MAAEAFLQIALENLTSLIKDEVGLIIGAKKEMKKLASIFTTLQAVLEDAELNHPESKPIHNWLIKLTDAAYEVDDILDECTTHFSRPKYLPGRFSVGKILFRHKIGERIKQAIGRLDEIAAERENFHLRETNLERPRHIFAARETGSRLNEADQIVGRDDDREKIVDILVNQVKDNGELSVLPIIGLAGLGKTTLAQFVFKEPRVVEHFDETIWVCVSDDFDRKNLIKAVIESASGKAMDSNSMRLDALQHHLWGLLNHKRYLLVLDDVWNEDLEKWSQFKNDLSTGLPGSSIVVTTRERSVAEIMRNLPSYDLKELSEEHCWMLLKHRAFGRDEEEQYPTLVPIGKQIARKCVGVPLAAKALGGLLRFKRTEKEWISIKESKILDFPPDKTMSMLPIVKLSYHHLPLEMRQCFTYCAIFPKDFVISKDKLVHFWMAHGYISSKGTLEVEDVGEQVLDELIMRSLLQISERDADGDDKKITMHDLYHDLALSIMKDKFPGMQVGGISTRASNSKIREVNLSEHYMAFPRSALGEMDITSTIKGYRRLRVLHASAEKLNYLPSTIGSLTHLRMLNLSHSRIRNLPNSICSLWNLEVLNLNNCSELVGFPKKMRYLRNLRHLLLEYCDSLQETPYNIRELTSLRTLSKFIVGQSKGHRLEELESLNLGGTLLLFNLERVENHMEAKKANLVEKHDLRELTLAWFAEFTEEQNHVMVLEALEPAQNLEHFGMFGFCGRHLANWMKSSTLPKLIKIRIGYCLSLTDISPLVESIHLESLDLEVVGIEYIVRGGNAVNSCFPALKEIRLSSLFNLKGFFEDEVDQEVCPKLRKLFVEKCPALVLPPLNNLAELECDNSLTLASIPKLENLKKFYAAIGKDMDCIPGESLERLTSVEVLRIAGAHEQCIPLHGLRGLNSLQELIICNSETLSCLPEGWLRHNSTLQELFIGGCLEFVDIPEEIKYLHSLRKIVFVNLEKMVCIPDAIKHVYSLESLHLLVLPVVAALPDWLGDLPSLTDLYIGGCEKIPSIPDVIQRMKNLKQLGINGCPDLEKRCEEGKGEDWHKIAHIPYRFIR